MRVELLVPLRTEPHSKPIIAFDTETWSKENRFVLGVVSHPTQGELRFTDATRMIDFLTSEELEGYHIFATKLDFDAFALFQSAQGGTELPPGFSMFDNGSKVIWIKREIRKWQRESEKGKHKQGEAKRHITWADSLNIFPAGVEQMGKTLQQVAKTYARHYKRTGNKESERLASYYNVAKLRPPGCNCNPENEDHDGCKSYLGKLSWEQMTKDQQEETFRYCSLDATVTRKFMEWFQQEINNLGATLRLTAASTAMDLFRRKYLREANQVIPQPHWTCLVESRASYYGGRTEDFVKGTVHGVWDYDVASMYPSSMIETAFPYPSPERFVKREAPPETCLQAEGFSYVKLQAPKAHIPILPYRHVEKLLFPWGEIEGVWTNLEIRYALDHGYKLKEIGWSYFTEKTFTPFHGYVGDLYAKRLTYAYPSDCDSSECGFHVAKSLAAKCQSAMATEEVVKLFLNGLYGKFAQNFLTEAEQIELGVKGKKQGGTFKRIEDASPEEIAFTGEHFPKYLYQGFVIDKAIPKLKSFMNPILSSYVTARARIKLHEFISLAMSEGAKVLYCDTDSLYVTKPLSFAVEEKVLGKLQVGKEWEWMTILGPKAKALMPKGGKEPSFTFKGFPRKSFRYVNPESLETVRTKPRKEAFAAAARGEQEVEFSRFLRFKEALARGKLPNEIVPVVKSFDPLDFPKRKIIGKPTLKALSEKSFETVPWEIRGNDIK